MSLPLLVKQTVSNVIDTLHPSQTFKRLIDVNDNTLLVEGKKINVTGELHLFAVGKAASFELKAMKDLLSPYQKPKLCVALTKKGHTVDDPEIIQLEGSHPYLSDENIRLTQTFIEFLQKVNPQDTLLFALSGGTSALLELPIPSITIDELKATHTSLLNSGKNINEINRIRKSLSQVKNGGLLNFVPTNHLIQFITCDVPNEHLPDVGSGPLLGQETSHHPLTFKTQSASKLLNSLCSHHPHMVKGPIYDCLLSDMEDDLCLKLPKGKNILASAGEATIELPPQHGLGGRNTHFVLSFAHKLYQQAENRDLHLFSMGTDGTDGPTDAAGAYLNYSLYKTLAADNDLQRFNSYEYFEKLGTLIKTGPTCTNVMDLRMIWRE